MPKTSLFSLDSLSCWFQISRCYTMNFPFFQMDPHSHGEFELMYVAHGVCKILWIDGDEMKDFLLREGEYIFLDCYTKHELSIEKSKPCRILNMELSLVPGSTSLSLGTLSQNSLALHHFLKHPISVYSCKDTNHYLYRILAEIQEQFHNPIDQLEDHICFHLLLSQFWIELSRQRAKKNTSPLGSIYTKKALAFIESHYDEEITVLEIAAICKISVSHLQRQFKTETGYTLVEQINMVRINKAKLLLETSSLSVVDIAIMVGFQNRQHFSYIFSKLAGCSPSLYKKQKGNYQFTEHLL